MTLLRKNRGPNSTLYDRYSISTLVWDSSTTDASRAQSHYDLDFVWLLVDAEEVMPLEERQGNRKAKSSGNRNRATPSTAGEHRKKSLIQSIWHYENFTCCAVSCTQGVQKVPKTPLLLFVVTLFALSRYLKNYLTLKLPCLSKQD